MRLKRVVAATLVLGGRSAGLSGPNDRQLTDPKSIASATTPMQKQSLSKTFMSPALSTAPHSGRTATRRH